MSTVTLPFVVLDEIAFFASESQRFELVRKAIEGYDLPEPPVGSPWTDSPLRLWSWYVLKLNGLDVDPDEHHPLTHWGIDTGFVTTDVRTFIWSIA